MADDGVSPLPRESPVAFAAFRAYLALGPERSIAKAAERVGKSVRLLERWASEHAWVNRAAGHDAQVASAAQDAYTKTAAELVSEQAAQAAELRLEALTQLRQIASGEGLGAREAIRLFFEAAMLERLSLGLPTSQSASKVEAQVEARANVRAEVEAVQRAMGEDDAVRRLLLDAANALAARLAAPQGQQERGEDDEDAGR